MKRRAFFRKFAGVIAAVALAPEIAFGVKLPLKRLPELQPWQLDIAAAFQWPVYNLYDFVMFGANESALEELRKRQKARDALRYSLPE